MGISGLTEVVKKSGYHFTGEKVGSLFASRKALTVLDGGAKSINRITRLIEDILDGKWDSSIGTWALYCKGDHECAAFTYLGTSLSGKFHHNLVVNCPLGKKVGAIFPSIIAQINLHNVGFALNSLVNYLAAP